MNIARFLTNNSFSYADKVAIVDGEKRFTYKQVNQRANCVAHALLDLGVQKCNRIGVLLGNCHQFVEIYFGLMKIGAIMVPISTRSTETDLEYFMKLSEARGILYDAQFQDKISALRSRIPALDIAVSINTTEVEDAGLYESMIGRSRSSEPLVEVFEDDTAILVPTGGTTGRPKLVEHTHKSSIWAALNIGREMDFRAEDISLAQLPMYHIGGLNAFLLPSFFWSLTHVIMRTFDAREFLRLVQLERITVIPAMPPNLLDWLMAVPDFEDFDLGSIRAIAASGATFPLTTKRHVLDRIPRAHMYYIYGLSEMGPFSTILKHTEIFNIDGSIGRTTAAVECRVVDNDEADIAVGEVGELLLKGPSIMKGYYKNPEETEAALKGGWLHTGDMVKHSEDGYIYFVDRKKDMIKSGGLNIYAKEVEDVLFTHSKIADVAVIGVPDEKWGEAVKALVVLKEGEQAKEEEIIDFCEGRITGYKKPKSIEFVEVLLRNPSGKVMKPELRTMYREKPQ